MATPTKVNFKIYQGGTFSEVLRWESATKGYAPITNITNAAPMVATSASHGLPPGWRGKFANVLGMVEVNALDYITVTSADSNTMTFNSINSIGFKPYVSGGVFEYNIPVDLTGYTARMQLRTKVDSPDIIHELTTENGGITISNTLKTITLNIPPTTTSVFNFSTAVHSLELVSSGGIVTPFFNGTSTLIKEVTR